MGDFRYHALDAKGEQYSNTIQAESVADAADKLRAAEVNLIAVEVANVPGGYEPPSSARRPAPSRHEPRSQRPGLAPRDVKIRLRDQPAGIVLLLVGSIFSFAGAVALAGGLMLWSAGNTEPATVMLILGAVFTSVGMGMIAFVVRWRRKRSRTYRDGEVAMATLEKVGHNRMVRVNNRNPLQLIWTFEIDGVTHRGKRSTFDGRVTAFVPDEKMWVLYRPSDPKNSVEWPPLS